MRARAKPTRGSKDVRDDRPVSLERVVRVGLYAVLVTPLAAWRGFLFPQLTPKVLAFQLVVEIVVAGWLALAVVGARSRERRGLALSIPAVPAALALAIGAAALGAFAGLDARRSFWGLLDRQDGLVLWLHWLGWIAAAVWYFGRPSTGAGSMVGYARFSFWVAVAAALTAVLEEASVRLFGEAPFLLQSIVPGRPSGIFGNPVALGPYLLFHIFFGLYLATSYGSSRRRGALAAVAAGEIVLVGAIVLGQTRGVLAGLALGVIVVAASLAVSPRSSRTARVAALAAIFAVVAVPAAAWMLRERVSSAAFVGRLLRLGSGESAEMRRLTWRSASRGFGDHPIVGWGHDNVYYALNRYYAPEHVRFNLAFTESRATWYDKSHNAYLDLAVERGAIGIVLFLLVAAVVARGVARVDDRALRMALGAALAAYLAANLVAFDTFGSLVGLGWTLALVETRGGGAAVGPALRRERPSAGAVPKPRWRVPALVVLGGALVFGIYCNVEIARAMAGYLQAQTLFPSDAVRGVETYRRAFERLSPYHPKEKLNCAYMIVNAAINRRELPPGSRELAVELTRAAIAAHPNDAAFHLVANDLYNGLAIAGETRWLVEAEAEGRRALELSPRRQEAMFNLGRTYVLSNQPARAVALNRDLVAENPTLPIAHWFLGLSLLADDKRGEAAAAVRKALELGYRFQRSGEADLARDLLGAHELEELLRH